MNKFYGPIGYEIIEEKTMIDEVSGEEIKTGIFEPKIVERYYSGDVIRNNSRRGSGNEINDEIKVSKSISIIADPFAYQYYFQIAYIVYLGVKWKVESVEPNYPRLTLEIGGVYNENT